MNNNLQGTISQTITISGSGLHTAGNHTITLFPASENSGIIFHQVKKERGKKNNTSITTIPANWRYTKKLPLCTCISRENSQVRTIEHLMAAFYACGIDNLIIQIQGNEVPIMDGSSLPFIKKIEAAGIKKQTSTRPIFRIKQAIHFSEGDRSIYIEPADALYLNISITLAKIGRLSWCGKMTPELFKQEMSAARTFGRLKNGLLAQLTRFNKDPICLGANTKSAVVIIGDKAVNKGGLRMPDEYIRHRVLDLVGDLMLSGGHIYGKITATSTAHRLNHGLLRAIFSEEI